VIFRNDPGLAPGGRILRYLQESAVSITMELPDSVDVQPHTNILVRDPTQFLRRVGCVMRVEKSSRKTRIELEVFPEFASLLTTDMRATYFTVPGTAAWIMNTLIPRERVLEIQTLWKAFYARERAGINAELWPAVKDSLQEILTFYEKEVPRVIQSNRFDVDAIIAKHRKGVFERDFMPALQDVAWNLAQARFSPLLEEVGRELWDLLPVWGLGWRYMYEHVPFTKKDHVKQRFKVFLDKEALPVLKSRTREVMALLSNLFQDTFRDPRVITALRKMVGEIAEDPQTLQVLKKLSTELFLKNDRLLSLVRERWEDKGLKKAFSSVGVKFEPLIRDAVNSIVLNEDGSCLSPRLSQVLRSRVLKKEGAWVLLESGSGPALPAGSVIAGRING